MRKLTLHYVRAQNVLCFGPDGFELRFADYGPVVQVRGINLDAPGTAECPASNGSGKSSIQALLSMGFYGESVKSPTKTKTAEFINADADAGEIEVRWDDYRLLRTFKRDKGGSVKSKIQLWESADRLWDKKSEVTKGAHNMQAEIERLLGMTHHTFCNVVIFDDSDTYDFLKAIPEVRRKMVENLLDLEQYRQYHQNAKDILKDLKKGVDRLSKEYESASSEVTACERRLAQLRQQESGWRAARRNEVDTLESKLKLKRRELSATTTGDRLAAWMKAQERIAELDRGIEDARSKSDRLTVALKTARATWNTARTESLELNRETHRLSLAVGAAEQALVTALKQIDGLESLKEGTSCPVCHATVNRDNYGDVLSHGRHQVDRCREAVAEAKRLHTEHFDRSSKKAAAVVVMEEKIGEADAKIATMEGASRKAAAEVAQLGKIPKPDGDVAERLLEAEVTELIRQLEAKKVEAAGDSPYKEIASQSEDEIVRRTSERDAKATELAAADAELPYYKFWVDGFGDGGIRRHVVSEMLPAFNAQAGHWLHVLMDGLIQLTFDDTLEATITRNGRSASYHNLSNGEKQRVKLAVPQAFAYGTMLNCGTCPGVVFLDEITGGGICKAGVVGVYNMIMELSKDRQVFVTTHNETLAKMLDGCESITLKKQNDITKLAS